MLDIITINLILFLVFPKDVFLYSQHTVFVWMYLLIGTGKRMTHCTKNENKNINK